MAPVKKPAEKTSAPKKPTVKKTPTKPASADTASKLIDGRIKELGDWRGVALARVRAIVKDAVPGVEETWKWRGVPVWEHNGIICTGETYKAGVKLTFARGASVPDPAGLFTSSLDGNVRRAVDIFEGQKINEKALKALVKAAADLNGENKKKKKKSSA